MKVLPISKTIAERFVKTKHYSRRASIFWAAYGLVIDGMIEGVVVYGQPSAPIQKYAFDGRNFKLYELSRLVVQTKAKNAASFLIANSLKMLESPCAVVSYADEAWGHSGIVYQATNWLYTGATKSHDHSYIVNGERLHPMSLRDMGITNPKQWARENRIETVPPQNKHRYFYLIGSKRQRRKMLESLRYKPLPLYPKCEKSMYDDGDNIVLFHDQSRHQSTLYEAALKLCLANHL